MKRSIMTALAALLAAGLASPMALADNHASMTAQPVELFACSYADGKTGKDLDKVVGSFNKWADGVGMDEYTAWTLVPYYATPEQDFDVLWLGHAPKAAALGMRQGQWLATGGKVQAEFDSVLPCNAHVNFASLMFKAPPQRDDPPDNVVISFSDCNMADGMDFTDDIAPAIEEWAEYRGEHGSTAGIWIMFPAYGGGDEDFDFKWVSGHRTLEEQGKDWDQYAEAGWQKAGELFGGKLECDSSRVYLATNRRRAAAEE